MRTVLGVAAIALAVLLTHLNIVPPYGHGVGGDGLLALSMALSFLGGVLIPRDRN